MTTLLRRAALAVAVAAALAPAPLRAEAAVAAAQKLLASKDWSERVKGLGELVAAGRPAEAEKAALPLLDDEDWGVEIAACKALVTIGNDAAKDALAKEGGFEGQVNEETMKKIAPGYSMFRMIVNVVKEKSDWVENL